MASSRLAAQAAKITEAKKKNAEERDRRTSTKGLPRILLLQPNTPTFFSVLSETTLDLYIHNVWNEPTEPGKKGRMTVHMCQRMYEDDPGSTQATQSCEHCQLLDDQGRKNPSINMKFLLGYVHSNEGATYKGSDGKDYDKDPIAVVTMRAGKGAINFQKYDELHRKNAFKLGKQVLQISKDGAGKETVYSGISVMPMDMIDQDEFDPRSEGFKAALGKYGAMTPDEIYGLFLNNICDVDWEWAGVDRPVADVVESEKAEDKPAEPVTTKKQAKNALD